MATPHPVRGSQGASPGVHLDRRPTFRFPIGWKFVVLVLAVIPSLVTVSLIAAAGMTNMKEQLDRVYEDNLASTQVVAQISGALREADVTAQRLLVEPDPVEGARLQGEVHERISLRVGTAIDELRELWIGQPDNIELVEELERSWSTYLGFIGSPEFIAAAGRPPAKTRTVSENLDQVGDSLTTLLERMQEEEAREANEAKAEGERSYERSLALFRVMVLVGLIAAIGGTAWLIRDVVVRVREYSSFAGTVAKGATNARIQPRGHDELTDLGWALNDMVARDEAARTYEDGQNEFIEAMQVAEAEDEAHDLLKRHLERSVRDSAVVVLNRNNSADRLETATQLPEQGLAERVAEAKPRDCISVRLARHHAQRAGTDPLIPCGLCHPLKGSTSCRPLLVGGEVIGSVLMNRPDPLGEVDAARFRDSVTQAAPVLANLRNLALAQLRAATDSLTGLPNTRAFQDTLNRLVAQASRMVWPLSAVLLDLDHFKRINDTFGHSRGDEVLAAVGVALHTTVRESDFVGRYGGEEFVMLLPNTDRAGAAILAERLRETIAEIDVLGDEHVTASFGVAMFPDDAPDAARLVRSADRALYRAKANGRNRVEFFSIDDDADRRDAAINSVDPAPASP